MKQIFGRYTLVATIIGLLVTSCGASTAQEDNTLKMALLPILDVLPFYVAQEKGYFEEEGIEVALVPIRSAQERDALLQAGEVDGALTDLQAVAIFNRETPQLRVAAKARKAYPDSPHFRVVAAPGVEINDPADLAGVPIGISQNTIIEYLNERLLTEWGLPKEDIAIEEVSAIPVRFELLMEGQIQAALLPEPLGEAAVVLGGSLIVDDTQFPQFSQSVLAFLNSSLENKPNTVQAFLKAWNKAVADINADPDAYRQVLIDNIPVPPPIQETYAIPRFPEGEITSEAEWADVVEWAQAAELLDGPVAYEDSVGVEFGE